MNGEEKQTQKTVKIQITVSAEKIANLIFEDIKTEDDKNEIPIISDNIKNLKLKLLDIDFKHNLKDGPMKPVERTLPITLLIEYEIKI